VEYFGGSLAMEARVKGLNVLHFIGADYSTSKQRTLFVHTRVTDELLYTTF